MSSYNECGCKGPSNSKRCRCEEDFDEPPRKHVAVPGVSSLDVAKLDMEWRTALHRAAKRGDEFRVKELLAEGYDPHLRDLYGYTPLLVALYEPNEAVANILIEHGCGISIADREGCTPLHAAVDYGFDELVKKLLLMDVNPHLQDNNGMYPLHSALRRPNRNSAVMILQMCAWKNICIDSEEMQLGYYAREFCISVLSECYNDIKRMKEAKVEDSYLTFYKIATASVEKVARYLANKNVRKIQNALLENFPNFSDLIALKMKRANVKRVMYDEFSECFTLLPREWPLLPSVCTEIISTYLNETDIRNFVSAFKFAQ